MPPPSKCCFSMFYSPWPWTLISPLQNLKHFCSKMHQCCNLGENPSRTYRWTDINCKKHNITNHPMWDRHKNIISTLREKASKMKIPCSHCWQADRPSLHLHLPTCYNRLDLLRHGKSSTVISLSAFHTHWSMHPPSRICPVRVDRPSLRSVLRSTSWDLWLMTVVDAAQESSCTPGIRCTRPVGLHLHQNASDVTALCPNHIMSTVQYGKSINAIPHSIWALEVKR